MLRIELKTEFYEESIFENAISRTTMYKKKKPHQSHAINLKTTGVQKTKRISRTALKSLWSERESIACFVYALVQLHNKYRKTKCISRSAKEACSPKMRKPH